MVSPSEGGPPTQVWGPCGPGCHGTLGSFGALSVGREASLWGVQSQAPRSDTLELMGQGWAWGSGACGCLACPCPG